MTNATRALTASARGLIALMAVCMPIRSAFSAPPRMPTIVLESNVGERPANMNELIAPLLDALAGYGFVVKPTTIANLLGPHVPRPGILDSGMTAKDIAHQVEVGLEAFRSGQFVEAERALTIAVQLIKRNPGLWVLDGGNATLTYKALVKLAVAQALNGHADESVATMLESYRMSGIPVTQSKDGPRAAKIFAGAERLAHAMGRGSLIVSVSDSHAVIFVDGQFRGIGKIAVADLLPGSRHMFVQVGSDGRQYEIPVSSDGETSLEIDWEVDSALTVDEQYVALAFATQSERAKEGSHARQLARQLGSEKVIVVGLIRLEGNLEVVGTVYPADGSAARRASVPVSEGEAGMRSLALFLFDGTLSGHLNVIDRGPGTLRASVAQSTGRHLSVPSMIVLGVGGVATLAGIAAYVFSKSDDHVSKTYDDHKTPAVKVVAASSPVVGAGIYLGLRDTTSASRLTSALLGVGAASLLAGTVLYLTDEDGYSGPGEVRKYYRESATGGVIVGGAGIALTGLGALLWYRERGRGAEGGSSVAPASPGEGKGLVSLLPTISLGSSNVMLHCSGRF